MQGLAMAMLMLQCAVLAAAHPVNSAIWFASAGLRLRGRMDASLAHTSFQTLTLRGGGERRMEVAEVASSNANTPAPGTENEEC